MTGKSITTIFLCGDVMTGRGIDQILPHPSLPDIYEGFVTDARGYVRFAEKRSGEIPRPVEVGYPWGDALAVLEKMAPDLRIINLETSVTRSGDFWRGKGINYRMHPANVGCLTAAGIDFCALSNNHVLDWGYPGLEETLATLCQAGVKTAGAGRNREEAAMPARLPLPSGGTAHLFSFGVESSGIPPEWGAAAGKPGVNLLPDLSEFSVSTVATQVKSVKRPGDLAIASIHWGGNWGFEVAPEELRFAHRLLDAAAVDLVHGHSSHHVKPIEVYRGKLILYGCGDFINDYEGIKGMEMFRGDLGLMYFPSIDLGSGALTRLVMVPTRLHKFRVQLAAPDETDWLAATLNRESKNFGTVVKVAEEGNLRLEMG